MRVSLSMYGWRGDAALAVGVAVRLRGLGAQVPACMPPHGAAAEEWDAPVATGVMPTGVWR